MAFVVFLGKKLDLLSTNYDIFVLRHLNADVKNNIFKWAPKL